MCHGTTGFVAAQTEFFEQQQKTASTEGRRQSSQAGETDLIHQQAAEAFRQLHADLEKQKRILDLVKTGILHSKQTVHFCVWFQGNCGDDKCSLMSESLPAERVIETSRPVEVTGALPVYITSFTDVQRARESACFESVIKLLNITNISFRD